MVLSGGQIILSGGCSRPLWEQPQVVYMHMYVHVRTYIYVRSHATPYQSWVGKQGMYGKDEMHGFSDLRICILLFAEAAQCTC